MNEKISMTIEMNVTEAQAITLKEMFNYWNYLGNIGSSRHVSFMVDGDGNFRPNCKMSFEKELTQLTEEELKKAIVSDYDGNRKYDFDGIAWILREKRK